MEGGKEREKVREHVFMLDSGDSEVAIKHTYRKTEGTEDFGLREGLGWVVKGAACNCCDASEMLTQSLTVLHGNKGNFGPV